MRRLVRLYPAYWRRRYGDEFDALLRDGSMGPHEAIDVVLGALDAHLHRPGRGAGAGSTKGTSMSIQLGGRAAIATSGFLLFGLLLWLTPAPMVGEAPSIIAPDGRDVTADWMRTPLRDLGTYLLFGLTPLAAIVAVAGLGAAPARVHRALTWTSIGLAAFGILAILHGMAAGIVPGAGIVALSGAFLVFAVAAYQTPGMSRRFSALLAVGAGSFTTVFFLSLSGIYPFGFGTEWWQTVASGLPFGIGWLGLGRDALRRGNAAPQQAPT